MKTTHVAPDKEEKKRGVTVISPHGRALTYGVSQDRTKQFMKSAFQQKTSDVMAAMLEQKAARQDGGASAAPRG